MSEQCQQSCSNQTGSEVEDLKPIVVVALLFPGSLLTIAMDVNSKGPNSNPDPLAKTFGHWLDLVQNEIRVKTIRLDELKMPGQLASNPMGISPAFQLDANVVTWESGTILK